MRQSSSTLHKYPLVTSHTKSHCAMTRSFGRFSIHPLRSFFYFCFPCCTHFHGLLQYVCYNHYHKRSSQRRSRLQLLFTPAIISHHQVTAQCTFPGHISLPVSPFISLAHNLYPRTHYAPILCINRSIPCCQQQNKVPRLFGVCAPMSQTTRR